MSAKVSLSPKQQTFLAALLAGHTIQTSAKAAGVSEKTAHVWLKRPHFQQAYDTAQQDLFDQALQGLRLKVDKAIATLDRNMDSEDSPPSTQVRAAQIVLEQAVNARKLASETPPPVAGMGIDTELLPFLDVDDLAEIRRRFDLAAQRQQARKAQ